MNDNEVEYIQDENGNKYYVLKNSVLDLSNKNIKYISENIIKLDGKLYFKNKLIYREDGPDVIGKDGSQYWHKNGKLHREDGPAIINTDGTQHWYKNGKLNREDGPAIIETDGTQYWHKNGQRHRTDGPAIEYTNGTKKWFINGLKHRVDGPAVEYKDNIYNEYWINGNKLPKENFLFEKELRETIINNNQHKKSKI